jgi:nucleotide-binding universal stress UspA family protein
VNLVTGEAAIAFPFEDYEKAVAANAAEILSKAREAASTTSVTCTTIHVKERHPAEGILETAKARSCDLIVMASHGRRGLIRLMLGSQAHNVVTNSTIPVLIFR